MSRLHCVGEYLQKYIHFILEIGNRFSRIDFRSKSLPRGARETPAGLIDRGDKKRKREERKEEAALLECFTSICTIMRVSGRRQGTCSSGKSKVSDSKASVTARNNKDDRKVNVFASGGWEGEG